jgi:hypothetical protein
MAERCGATNWVGNHEFEPATKKEIKEYRKDYGDDAVCGRAEDHKIHKVRW